MKRLIHRLLVVLFVALVVFGRASATAEYEMLDTTTEPIENIPGGIYQIYHFHTTGDVYALKVSGENESGGSVSSKNLGSDLLSDGTIVWHVQLEIIDPTQISFTVELYDSNFESMSSRTYYIIAEKQQTSGNQSGSSGSADWPIVEMTGGSAWTVDRSESRIQSRTGPHNSYAGGGAYKNSKITSLQVFFVEKQAGQAWVYTELEYANGYKRRIYFRTNAIKYNQQLQPPEFSETVGKITRDVVPVFGPGYDYDDLRRDNDSVVLKAGHSVMILCEENDYLFIDCDSSIGRVRIWVPKDVVEASIG